MSPSGMQMCMILFKEKRTFSNPPSSCLLEGWAKEDSGSGTEHSLHRRKLRKRSRSQSMWKRQCPLVLHVFTTSNGPHCHQMFSFRNMLAALKRAADHPERTVVKEVYPEAGRRSHTSILQLFLWILNDLDVELRWPIAPIGTDCFMASKSQSTE